MRAVTCRIELNLEEGKHINILNRNDVTDEALIQVAIDEFLDWIVEHEESLIDYVQARITEIPS